VLDAQLLPSLLPVEMLRQLHLLAPPPVLVARKVAVALGAATLLHAQSAMGQQWVRQSAMD
jgi:hypothetical protein